MPTRRELVQASAVMAGAIPLVPQFSFASATSADHAEIYRVVYDRRHSASRMFAAEAKRLGATVRGIADEVNQLWSQELYSRWREAPVAIAGMTSYAALFSLETMAQDARMRVVYRVHHRDEGHGMIHEAFGPREIVDAANLGGTEAEWSRNIAGLVMAWPKSAAHAPSTIASADVKAVPRKTLVSWVIAPLARG